VWPCPELNLSVDILTANNGAELMLVYQQIRQTVTGCSWPQIILISFGRNTVRSLGPATYNNLISNSSLPFGGLAVAADKDFS